MKCVYCTNTTQYSVLTKTINYNSVITTVFLSTNQRKYLTFAYFKSFCRVLIKCQVKRLGQVHHMPCHKPYPDVIISKSLPLQPTRGVSSCLSPEAVTSCDTATDDVDTADEYPDSFA